MAGNLGFHKSDQMRYIITDKDYGRDCYRGGHSGYWQIWTITSGKLPETLNGRSRNDEEELLDNQGR